MESKEYNLYCDFDIEKHKKTYINYLEIIIKEDGTPVYAVPSHQKMLIKMACNNLNITEKELNDMYINVDNMFTDWLEWLCDKSKCVAVWNEYCMYKTINSHQVSTLRLLKMNGLYKGEIPYHNC